MDASTRILRLVRNCLGTLNEAGGGIVVAVSGGPDSVALARAVLAVREPTRPAPVVLAHLNHQLRGADSDADQDFVARFHADLQASGNPFVDLCCHRIDVAARAHSRKENLEALARRVRYQWLAGVARARGLRWVATGHTADDQAETVLHRLLRGTGLQGLRGIAECRELESGVGVVRPLLRATRREVLAYLGAIGQAYRLDKSNDDPRFTRNRIRHELLPLLEARYNPGIVRLLAHLAGQAEEAHRAETEEAGRLLERAERPRAGGMLVLDRAVLAAAAPHRVRALFRLLWAREGWPTGRMGFAQWGRLAALARGETRALDLPEGVRVRGLERVIQAWRQGGVTPLS